MTHRCPTCGRRTRSLVGDYDVCRSCDRKLEAEITAWSRKIDRDLSLLERFDAFVNNRRSVRSESAEPPTQ